KIKMKKGNKKRHCSFSARHEKLFKEPQIQNIHICTGLEPNGGYCIGSGCFALFRDPTNFRTAQSLCNAKGGHLMTVRSSVSNDVLSILLGNLTGLMGFQWVTKDSESDFTNFVPSFNSSCSAHSCVSVNKEDGFKWRQTPCGHFDVPLVVFKPFLCSFYASGRCPAGK
uniref:C-type lectin domain-containing protein n=1 Tax=Kryptolebias marmoratus TaxID=37003 RepID=A0A3Q3B9N9_KRYMA